MEKFFLQRKIISSRNTDKKNIHKNNITLRWKVISIDKKIFFLLVNESNSKHEHRFFLHRLSVCSLPTHVRGMIISPSAYVPSCAYRCVRAKVNWHRLRNYFFRIALQRSLLGYFFSNVTRARVLSQLFASRPQCLILLFVLSWLLNFTMEVTVPIEAKKGDSFFCQNFRYGYAHHHSVAETE